MSASSADTDAMRASLTSPLRRVVLTSHADPRWRGVRLEANVSDSYGKRREREDLFAGNVRLRHGR